MMMTSLTPHMSSAELESEYKAASDPVAKSHFHALWLVSEGYAAAEVARLLSFSARWVHSLIGRYNEKGPSALADLRAGNGARPRILTPKALEALKERIKTAPPDGGLWSGPKIARWLAQFHGLKSVHDQRGWDALVAIGYSVQKPRPRHPQAATEEDRAALKKSSRMRRRRSSASIRRPASNCGRWMSTGSA
jgi:transposase